MSKLRSTVRAATAIFCRDPWWAELWSALTALAWVVLSYASTEQLAVWPSMQVLLQISDDRFWQLIGLCLGLAQLTFLFCNRRWLRWSAAIFLTWFWAVLTLGVWVAVPGAPGVAVYAGWCGVNLLSTLRHFHRPK